MHGRSVVEMSDSCRQVIRLPQGTSGSRLFNR